MAAVTVSSVALPTDLPLADRKVAVTVAASACEPVPPSQPPRLNLTFPWLICPSAFDTSMPGGAVLVPPPGGGKKFWPRSAEPAELNAGYPPAAPYCTSLSRPVVVQPGTLGAVVPVSVALPISAPPLTIRFGCPGS